MKRFLHALAALWPKKRATGSPPDPDTGSGIQEHLDAVLRMERILSGFAEVTVGASALTESAVLDGKPSLSEPGRDEFANLAIREFAEKALEIYREGRWL